MTARHVDARAVVRVDARLCRGTGLCQAMSPALFRLTRAGYAIPVDGELYDDDTVRLARSVADCCPMGAVEVLPGDDADATGPESAGT
ncbi:ferredoxin [Streptomyces echinoruber]|uniref:Ferredoxin n=1 Tax=Streptomyces echinoruber TaxID=68898 RepID=A0A918RIU2_9ACTN|nr:ferredoxin [Streptomyces echinoruber]GHA00498.1 hypothetical protein GCM10010389_44650 [Streptomyces echinoruber]